MKKGNVVIWHIGRCGSTVLSSMLNQHPEIESLKEVFNPLMKSKILGEEIPDFDSTFCNLESYDSSKIQVAEVKFLDSQHLSVYNKTLLDLVNKFIEIGYDKFVILERKNYLERMVSHCVGQETSIYHLRKSETPKIHKIVLDMNEITVGVHTHSLLEWFRVIDTSYNNLRKYLADSSFIELQFEEDIQNDVNKAYKKVCSFLNIDISQVEIPFTRTNPFEVKDILINYDEIKKLLKKNGFSWMLNKRANNYYI